MVCQVVSDSKLNIFILPKTTRNALIFTILALNGLNMQILNFFNTRQMNHSGASPDKVGEGLAWITLYIQYTSFIHFWSILYLNKEKNNSSTKF